MEVEIAICLSGMIALFMAEWNCQKKIDKEMAAQRRHINKCMKEIYDSMNAFFAAMQDIDRDNREKIDALILAIIDSVKNEEG